MDDNYETSQDTTEASAQQYVGSTLVIPFDAPIPNELKGIPMATGPLLARLQLLLEHDVDSFDILPLRGEEMTQLARLWSLITTGKKLYVLKGLPGTRYDVLFDQGIRAVGLPVIQWPTLASAIAREILEQQRTQDSQPWTSDKTELTEAEAERIATRLAKTKHRKPAGPADAPVILETPAIADEDDSVED